MPHFRSIITLKTEILVKRERGAGGEYPSQSLYDPQRGLLNMNVMVH